MLMYRIVDKSMCKKLAVHCRIGLFIITRLHDGLLHDVQTVLLASKANANIHYNFY